MNQKWVEILGQYKLNKTLKLQQRKVDGGCPWDEVLQMVIRNARPMGAQWNCQARSWVQKQYFFPVVHN